MLHHHIIVNGLEVIILKIKTESKTLKHPYSISYFFRAAVVAQWIKPGTLKSEVPGSSVLEAAVVPLARHFILIA